jgi:perosamine synthetase
MISISKPCIGKEEQQAVLKVLKSGLLSQGSVVQQFEKAFASYCNVKYAVTASNGTTALHLALLALGIGPGSEVITTPFSFIATANAILYVGAKPVFIDINQSTFNINPDQIESRITSRTKAILPVHLFGLPADMEKIMQIARKHNLIVIEDACQAHGAVFNGKKVGSLGDVGCFSFYPTKNMTSGEGGMVTTNNKKLAQQIKILRNHGMQKKYHHDVLGYNFRMTDIHAAIGLVQLKKLDAANKKRIQNAAYLSKRLSDYVQIPSVPASYSHVFNQYTIKIAKNRDKIQKELEKKGVGCAVYYPIPIHKQKIYKDMYKNQIFPIAEKMSKQVLSIPVRPGLTRKDLDTIINSIKRVI